MGHQKQGAGMEFEETTASAKASDNARLLANGDATTNSNKGEGKQQHDAGVRMCEKVANKGRRRVGWKPIALDGGYGWVVVFGSFLIHVFADGFVYSFGVIAESLIKEFDATNTEVSTVLSLLTGLMLATGPLASAVCNRIGCRVTTIAGALIAAVGCLASHYAQSMRFLVGSVGVVMGLGFGLMYCPAIVIVTIYFERRRSLATGITVCGAGVGTFLFSNVIGQLIANFGWRQVFFIYAALVLLCVPCGALYRPVQFEPIYEEGDEEEEEESTKEKYEGGGRKPTQDYANGGACPLSSTTPIANGGKVDSDHKVPPSPPPPEVNDIAATHPDTFDLHHGIIQQSSQPGSRRDSRSGGAWGGLLRSPPRQAYPPHYTLRMAHSTQGLSSQPASTKDSTTGGVASTTGASGGGGVMQRFRSMGEQLHLRSRGIPHAQAPHSGHGPLAEGREGGGKSVCTSTGYLNLKDVFYRRSIMDLPEYARDERRFRSVSCLLADQRRQDGHPQAQHKAHPHLHHLGPDGGGGNLGRLAASATHLQHVVEKIEEKEEEEDEENCKAAEKKPVGGLSELEAEEEDEEDDSRATSASRAIEIWSPPTSTSPTSPVVVKPIRYHIGGYLHPNEQHPPPYYGSFNTAGGTPPSHRLRGEGKMKTKSPPKNRPSTFSTLLYFGFKRLCQFLRTIKRMMDLELLADPIYLLFAISNFFTSIGFNAPPMFMPMNAEKVLGFRVEEAAATVAAYGLANTFGRIGFGLICDKRLPTRWGRDRARNRLWIYNLTLMLCGAASCFVFAMRSLRSFTAYCFFFGFTISSYVCLTSVVLVDLVGVDRLTNAFGLLLFIQGLATFVGPPMAGQLYDLTQRYDWTFAFCGACLFVSGAMLFFIPHIQQRRRQKEQRYSNSETCPALMDRENDEEEWAKGPC